MTTISNNCSHVLNFLRQPGSSWCRVNAVAVEPVKTTQKTKLHDLWDSQKQSPWYDNLQRPVGELLQKQYDVGIRGVTSNPTVRSDLPSSLCCTFQEVEDCAYFIALDPVM